MTFCPSCGTKNIDNAAFCISCGQKLVSTTSDRAGTLSGHITGFTLNPESVRIVWITAFIVGVIEVILAVIISSGSDTISDPETANAFMPFGFALGYILCLVYGFLVLKNAEPSNVSPWAAPKKVAKILIVVGLITMVITTFLSVSEIDTEAMNQAMRDGENFDFPLLADLGGSLGLNPIFSWLIGGFILIYGVVKYQLSKYPPKIPERY